MAAVPKSSIVIGSGTGAAGTTKASPGVTGAWIDVTSVNGGVLGGRIKNNGAVGVAGTLLWQWSPDPTAGTPKIYDLWQFGGDLASGSDITVSTRLDKEIKFVRMLGYGNTTSSVLYESDLAASS
jgi:hypothetical protein